MAGETTRTRQIESFWLEATMAILLALVLGFLAGFGSQAFGAEPEPKAPEDEAADEAEAPADPAALSAQIHAGLVEVLTALTKAREGDDSILSGCLGGKVGLLRGLDLGVRSTADDHELARIRGDEAAMAAAEEKALRASTQAEELLAEARACLSVERARDGELIVRVDRGELGPEDGGFGPPPPSGTRPRDSSPDR